MASYQYLLLTKTSVHSIVAGSVQVTEHDLILKYQNTQALEVSIASHQYLLFVNMAVHSIVAGAVELMEHALILKYQNTVAYKHVTR